MNEISIGLIASKNGEDYIIEVSGPETGAYLIVGRSSTGAVQRFLSYALRPALTFIDKAKATLIADGWDVIELTDLSQAATARKNSRSF